MSLNRFTSRFQPARAGKIFITGGAGFIGSHLVDLLLKNECRVVAVDDLSTGILQNLDDAFGHSHFEFIQSNVLHLNWQTLLRPNDTVVHLAASVGVDKVCASALSTALNNHRPLEHLLEAAAAVQNVRILYAGTSEVYGNTTPAGAGEQDMLQVHTHLGGRSAYTVSKLYGELLALSYADTCQIPVTIMRLFNTIGPRQRSEYGMVVPRFIQQALNHSPITIYGDGTQTRSFCDVRDVVRAIWLLLHQNTTRPAVYNIGNPIEITIRELAQFIKTETGSSAPIQYLPFPPERSGCTDIRYRRPDISSIAGDLGWMPEIAWQDSVRSILRENVEAYAQCVYS